MLVCKFMKKFCVKREINKIIRSFQINNTEKVDLKPSNYENILRKIKQFNYKVWYQEAKGKNFYSLP